MMKTSAIIPHVPELINEFVVLKNKLQQTFIQSFSNIQDLEYLSNCPRQGVIKIDKEKWYFQRHGIGISFTEEKSEKTIDISNNINNRHNKLDTWELLQYCDSMGIEYLQFNHDIFEINNQESLRILIEIVNPSVK